MNAPSMLSPRARLAAAIAASELPKYVYGYPTKRAFRDLDPPRTIASIWAGVDGPLNLYIHVPFCGYRCSFCTLFLTTSQTPQMVQDYVDSLVRQIATYGERLGHMQIVSLYLGGGTPTILSPAQLDQIFTALHAAFPDWRDDAEVGLEGSPDTMRAELLARARAVGVNRVSMGLQSLDPQEQARAGRRYAPEVVFEAVETIAAQSFANVNYDLIYGLEGQTRETWLRSLEQTVAFGPQTITLYPVVVRPLTSLSKRVSRSPDRFLDNASKYALYDESVTELGERGFRQNSFVRFSRCEHDGLRQEVADFSGVPLLGFGAGSRSYTRELHYSTEFAVGRRESLDIIAGFIAHDHRLDAEIAFGFELSDDEQRRRHCILNLSLGGLETAGYRARFDAEPAADFGGELDALIAEGCCVRTPTGFALTAKGFKYSNVIGDLFQSPAVTKLEAAYQPR